MHVAVEELLMGEVAMTSVEKDKTENLAVQHPVMQREPLLDPLRARQDFSRPELSDHFIFEDQERLCDDLNFLLVKTTCAGLLNRGA